MPAASRTTDARAAARRLGRFLPRHLIAHLLPDLDLSCEDQRARLTSRYLRAAYGKVLRELAQAGVQTFAFKGYASAFALYPDPDLRVAGDLDVLVARPDLAAAVDILAQHGLHPAAMETGPWGFSARNSFLPFVGRDGLVNVDLHTEADEYPLSRALPARRLLQCTAWSEAAATRLPSREEASLILLSHAARERFGPGTVKQMLDLTRTLPAGPCPADWQEVWDLAAQAYLRKPLGAALALLEALDVDLGPLPQPVRQAAERRRHSRRLAVLAQRWRALFPQGDAGLTGKLFDELMLTAEPRVALYRQGQRLRGLLRPASGYPTTNGTA